MSWEEFAATYARYLIDLREEYGLDDRFIIRIADSTKEFAAHYHTAIKNGELPDDYFTQDKQKTLDQINDILKENGEEL